MNLKLAYIASERYANPSVQFRSKFVDLSDTLPGYNMSDYPGLFSVEEGDRAYEQRWRTLTVDPPAGWPYGVGSGAEISESITETEMIRVFALTGGGTLTRRAADPWTTAEIDTELETALDAASWSSPGAGATIYNYLDDAYINAVRGRGEYRIVVPLVLKDHPFVVRLGWDDYLEGVVSPIESGHIEFNILPDMLSLTPLDDQDAYDSTWTALPAPEVGRRRNYSIGGVRAKGYWGNFR